MKKSLLKQKIHDCIDKIEDKEFLLAVYVIVQKFVAKESIRGKKKKGKPEK